MEFYFSRYIPLYDFSYIHSHAEGQKIQTHPTEVTWAGEVSETEINLKVKSNHLRDFTRHKDDLIIGGLLLVNCETGHRALRVEPRTFRVKCSNGMVLQPS